MLSFVLLTVGGAAAAPTMMVDDCKPVTTPADFNFASYITGRWYIQQQMAVSYLPASQNYCVTAQYSYTDASKTAAHVHNYLHARQALARAERPAPTHVLFLAHNCFFLRVGVEAYIGARGASAAIRACPESTKKPKKEHCALQPWFAELNRHREARPWRSRRPSTTSL